MGTRTIIFFSEKDNEYLNCKSIPIYKHWDGYPSYVLHLMRQYLEVNKKRIHHIMYLSAGFLRYIENHDYELEIPNVYENKDEFDEEFQDPYRGYGLYPQRITRRLLNGWENYYYKITSKNIYVYSGYYNEDKPKFKAHPLLMRKISIDELMEMPDSRDYFESLQNEIEHSSYPDEHYTRQVEV